MLASLTGGILIGVSAAILLVAHGKVAGISGVVGGVVRNRDPVWRLWFLGGLIAGGLLFALVAPTQLAVPPVAPSLMIVAGLLVGFGTRLGGGCTSGHGVCGIGRLSPRSLVATLTFMATGALTVFVMRHL